MCIDNPLFNEGFGESGLPNGGGGGKTPALLLLLLLSLSGLSAQSALPGGHQGAVITLIEDPQGRVLSAGADGFLELWDPRRGVAQERFQLSRYPIQSMTLRPGKSEITVIERDPLGTCRLSAWNYETKEQRFSLTFQDALSFITYSAGGTFLIAVQSGRSALVFVHADTGTFLQSPQVNVPVSFAATGKSERTMITYAPAGVLSYWDLESGREIRRFAVPPRLGSPLLFSNNRFLGGIDPGGLVILDAVSGAVLTRERQIPQGFLLSLLPESSDFMCLSLGASESTLYRFTLSNPGKLEAKQQWKVPPSIASITSGVVTADAVVLGTSTGSLWLGKATGSPQLMAVQNQRLITEAAVSGASLAFLTQDHALGLIPVDYTRLKNRQILDLEEVSYTQITGNPLPEADSDQFILWQDTHTRSFPVLRTWDPPSSRWKETPLSKLPLRFPLRSAALLGEKSLFLDSLGTITILSTKTGGILFSFSSIAVLDGVFLNPTNILLGRGAVSGDTPFLMVNMVTGETVPLAYPASVGARVYRGASGSPYGVAIVSGQGTLKTVILRLNTAQPARSTTLVEWEGEDTAFGMAESQGSLAAALGNQGGFLYTEGSAIPLERSAGLPRRFLDGGAFLITLDSEGNLAWHDPDSGKILARFHLYPKGWLLEQAGKPAIEGTINDR